MIVLTNQDAAPASTLIAQGIGRTLFSSEIIDNRILLKTSAFSALSIFLATSFGPLQRVLDTVELSVEQWAICIVGAALIIVVAEARKFVRRRALVSDTATAGVPAVPATA